ncbi:MAG: hypothetical protein IKQ24_09635 [Verrucomicrobia bacterium]|nr:hypothetical protein [Verrucomicrobiota bacterium]
MIRRGISREGIPSRVMPRPSGARGEVLAAGAAVGGAVSELSVPGSVMPPGLDGSELPPPASVPNRFPVEELMLTRS